MKRVAAVIATILLLAIGPAIVIVVRDGWADWRRFEPQQFRTAAARGDLDELERHARAAVDQDALRGLSRARVRSLLGSPDRLARRSRTYIWDLGMINGFMGPGDQGAFRVRFDRQWHVIAAEVS